MSQTTVDEVISEIKSIDNAIRDGLNNGDINEKMENIGQRIVSIYLTLNDSKNDVVFLQSKLFQIKHAARNEQNFDVLRAFSAPMFFWKFITAYKATNVIHNETFMKNQLLKLEKYDSGNIPASASGNKMASASGSGILKSNRTPVRARETSPISEITASPPVSKHTTHPTTVPPQSLAKKKLNSAIRINNELKRLKISLQDSIPTVNPVPRVVVIPDRRKKTDEDSEGSQNSDEDSSDEDASSTKKHQIKRTLPVIGHAINKRPCKRCLKSRRDCWRQARGRGACFPCGKLKVKCSLRDERESATTPTPTPMKKRKKVKKAPSLSSDSDEEILPPSKRQKTVLPGKIDFYNID